MKKELKFGIVIEYESDGYDIDDIGELLAADIQEFYDNGEDLFEVFYRGAENYEDF